MNSRKQDDEILTALRKKWCEVPSTTQGRIYSSDLLKLDDEEFRQTWFELYQNNCGGDGFSVRGWYHELYQPLANLGGKWLEVGSGLGYDGVYFAGYCGANVTFLDIIEDNLLVIERICKLLDIKNVTFKHLKNIETIEELGSFDVILAIGSLINAPFEFMCRERKALADHLVDNGRWLELAYPPERWAREGCLPFSEWGKKTDGQNTPYVEWYDLAKLTQSLLPHKFDVVLDYPYHSSDFIFFDLIKNQRSQSQPEQQSELREKFTYANAS